MEKSEKIKKHKTGKTLILCFVAFFMVYIGVNLVINSGGTMKTYIARYGEESESYTADGYIFRSQTVIEAPKSGYLECVSDETGRVPKGGTVAYIYENELKQETKNRLAEIEKEIKTLESENLSVSASESDAVRLNQDILSEVMTFGVSARDKDMDAVYSSRDKLDFVSREKAKMTGSGESDEELLKNLRAEKDNLEKNNDVTRSAVKSPVAGAFCATVDGLEEALSLDKTEEISQSYLNSIGKPSTEELKSKVAGGEKIGKVVDTFKWYFAAVIPQDWAESLKEGDLVRLKFLDSSDTIIKGNISRITDKKDDKAVIVIESSQYVDNLYSMSKAKVEIIKKTYEGARIPAESVRVLNNEKGVYVVSNNKAKFKIAKVYYIDEDWAIVQCVKTNNAEDKPYLRIYDEVIVSGSNIYEGKVVR